MAVKWIERLKSKWGVTSNRDFFLILLTFTLAGSMISVCRPPIFHLLGITKQTHLWIKVLVYIPLIPPIYQIFLLVWGTLLGQFDFFWEKEKRLGRFLKQSLSKAFATVRRS